MEIIKKDPDEFGGMQTKVLSVEEAKQRYCCRKFCATPGMIQMMIPGEAGKAFRVVCARHFIMLMIIQAAVLGDPSPVAEGKRLAEKYGIPFDNIPDVDVPQIVDFKTAICDRCGGKAFSETVGMYAGRRWIHTCMTDEELRAGEDA